MKKLADLMFEARILKDTKRTGFTFLGAGTESVAEHSFMVSFIGFLMVRLNPGIDAHRLICMCLIHDLPEARMGDLNYLQKKYVTPKEADAVSDMTRGIPDGESIEALITEFNKEETVEARLARDADQLALLIDLKNLSDMGYRTPEAWIPHVSNRLVTDTGKELAESILQTHRDDWWMEKFR